MKRALLLSALIVLSAVCHAVGQQAAKPETEITLVRGCTSDLIPLNPWVLGPDYDVSLGDDGRAVYRGRSGMSEFGSLQYPVSPSDVRQLAAEFDRSGFFELQSLYGGLRDHDCAATLTLRIGARQHIVRAFSSGNPPEVVGRLVRRVEAVAQILRFSQRSPAAAAQDPPSFTLGVYANLLERLNWAWPEARLLQESLKANSVSTPEAAESLAWAAFQRKKGGIGPDEVVQISGLYRVGRAVKGFAESGELAWEARIWNGTGTSDLIWIAAKTGAVLSWVAAIDPPATPTTGTR